MFKEYMKLTLIRGLPGAGKTTLAKSMAGMFHVEADMYFVDTAGRYVFDRTKIGAAHDWCQIEAAKALERGEDVVVSNTFVKRWELEPYIKMANTLHAELEVITIPDARYNNVHSVPKGVLERMKASWEPFEGEQHV